jgi:acyl-CoA reductase-like NAD-dependent aldehyde dehydrogenase
MNEYGASGSGCRTGDNSETINVENPATNEIIGTVRNFGKDEVDRAIGKGGEAFEGWKRTSLNDRRIVLLKMAEVLDTYREELASTLVLEVGKPLPEARHEVMSAARVFRTFAHMPIERSTISDDEGTHIYVSRKPLGVASLILPWNYPLAVLSWKLAPALLAGNGVVVKPSPYTPLNTMGFVSRTAGILPDHLVQVLTGDDQTGEHLVRSSAIRKIAFTGSMATGKRILAESSQTIKRVSLELGGNDPAIILKDFDLDQTPSVFWSSFMNAGQICIAVKRVYVHESIVSEFLDRYVRIAKGVKIGNGMDDGIQMGPVNNPEQLGFVEELVEDARNFGCTILTGGERVAGPGYFYKPTVISGADDGTRIVREEQFGPVVPILTFSDIDEVVDRANSPEYGLGASVWTSDIQKGIRVADQFESGTAWVNTHMVVDPSAPFGGVKGSGIGRELGIQGFDEYCDMQTIHVKK